MALSEQKVISSKHPPSQGMLNRVGIARLPWQVCYLQCGLSTVQERKTLCIPKASIHSQLALPRRELVVWAGQPRRTDGGEGLAWKTQEQEAGPGKVLALFACNYLQVRLLIYRKMVTLLPACQHLGERDLSVCKTLEDLFMAYTA